MNHTLITLWQTFGLLGAAICSVCYQALPLSRGRSMPPWMILFVAAVASGLGTGYLDLRAVLALALFWLAADCAARPALRPALRSTAAVLTAVLALALATHRLPGFHNPVLIDNVVVSSGAVPFTQYLNFDKGAVGLILLALLCRRSSGAAQWREVWRRALPIAAVTAVAVLGVALGIGYVRPDFKLSQFTALFVATNLLFTCVAEEAFFRGFLQEKLNGALPATRWAAIVSVAVSALLFGAAHAGGGLVYVVLATMGGIGYALAYQMVRRIEAPIIVHILLNTVHVMFFTYPHL